MARYRNYLETRRSNALKGVKTQFKKHIWPEILFGVSTMIATLVNPWGLLDFVPHAFISSVVVLFAFFLLLVFWNFFISGFRVYRKQQDEFEKLLDEQRDKSQQVISSKDDELQGLKNELRSVQGELDSLKGKLPRIEFRKPRIVTALVESEGVKQDVEGHFLLIDVANDPNPQVTGGVAEGVTGEMTIIVQKGALVREQPTRWEEKPQQTTLNKYDSDKSSDLLEMDLKPNGRNHGINTVVYIPSVKGMYLWLQSGKGKRIEHDTFVINLRIRGTGIDQTAQYTVKVDHSTDKGFKVTEGSEEFNSSISQITPLNNASLPFTTGASIRDTPTPPKIEG